MHNPAGGQPPGSDNGAEVAPFPARVPDESGVPQTLGHEDVLRARLDVLRAEHRALDEAVAALGPAACMLTLQRMKRQKLALKDQIARIEDELTPDIIA